MAFKVGSDTVIDSDGLEFKSFKKLSGTILDTRIELDVSENSPGDIFGAVVAVGCGRLVSTSIFYDGGDTNQGAAFLYRMDSDTRPEIKKLLTSSNQTGSDYFGRAAGIGSGVVAIGMDAGNTFTGAVDVFNLEGDHLKRITAPDAESGDQFGRSVGVGCGKIAVGAPAEDTGTGDNNGSAYVFNRNGTTPITIRNPNPGTYGSNRFGDSIAVGCGRIAVGCEFENFATPASNNYKGAVYIYDLKGQYLRRIEAPDGDEYHVFGRGLAVGCGKIVVGASGQVADIDIPGAVYVFDLNGNYERKITASDGVNDDQFGVSVAVSDDTIAVGAVGHNNDKGAVYIYDLNGNFIEKFIESGASSNAYFGGAISMKNGTLLVGSSGEGLGGAAYTYQINQNQSTYWDSILEGYLDSDDYFN